MSEQTIEQSGTDTRRTVVDDATGWGVSLLLHVLLVGVLALITWTVIETRRDEFHITLGEDPLGMDAAGDGGEDAVSSAAAGENPQPNDPSPLGTPLPQMPRPPEPITAPDPAALGAAISDPAAFSALDPTLALATEPTPGGLPGGAPAGTGLLEGTSGEFQRVAQGMGRRGLDIVLVIDATDSMAPYIEQAKVRLHDVVNVIAGILRDAGGPPGRGLVRFGVVAYKDYGDEFGLDATVSLPLTEDADKIREFIEQIAAGGGGDAPEPIHKALEKADSNAMNWRGGRMAIILLVGDAPVHTTERSTAFSVAERFARRRGGTIHTIDVGGVGSQGGLPRRSVLPDFQRIANAGNGSAFLLSDEERFWRHLITSVFGERYARDVDLILEQYATQR